MSFPAGSTTTSGRRSSTEWDILLSRFTGITDRRYGLQMLYEILWPGLLAGETLWFLLLCACELRRAVQMYAFRAVATLPTIDNGCVTEETVWDQVLVFTRQILLQF